MSMEPEEAEEPLQINGLWHSVDVSGTPWIGVLERVKGIEPSYEAWEAAVLPLNYTRISQTADGKAAIGDRREYRCMPFEVRAAARTSRPNTPYRA